MAILAGLFGLLCGVAYAWAWVYLRGERLARAVTDGAWPVPALNPKIHGSLRMGRIDWGAGALFDLVLGRASDVRATDIQVRDERGHLCLRIPEARARIDVRALLFSGDFLISSGHVPSAYVLLEAVPVADPEHPTQIGLLGAFTARHPTGTRGPRVELHDLGIDHLDLDLRQPDWQLRIPDAAIRGGLRHDGGDVAVEGMPFRLETPAPLSAKLTVLGLPFLLRDVRFSRFEASPLHPGDLGVALIGSTAEGARISADGALTSIFGLHTGIQMRFGIRAAGPLLSRLGGIPIGGDVDVKSTISGDLSAPVIDLSASGARLSVRRVVVSHVRADVRISGKAIEAKEIAAKLLGGAVTAHGRLDLAAGQWQGDIDVDDVDPGAFAPGLAGRLTLHARLDGRTDEPSGRADLDAALTLKKPGVLPRRWDARGSLRLRGGTVRTDGLTVSSAGASARLRGSARIDGKALDLHADVTAERLDRLAPELSGARGLRIACDVRGSAERPTATGTVSLRSWQAGPVAIGEISSPFDADRDALHLSRVRAKAAGGLLRGEASLENLRTSPTLSAKGDLSALDLGLLRGAPARGKVSGGFRLDGPLRSLQGRASLRSERVEALGYALEDLEAGVRLERDSVRLEDLHARVGGGRLRAQGSLSPDGAIVATVDLDGLRLDRSLPVPMAGIVTAHLDLGGTWKAPRLSGRVDLRGFRLRQVDLGDGHLSLAPGDASTALQGGFFDDRLRIEAKLALTPLALEGLLVIDRFDLADPIPEMRDLGFVSAPASGRIRFSWDAAHGLREADFQLTSLRVTHRDEAGHKIVVKNRRPVRVRYRNGRATLSPAELESKSGSFAMEGWIERRDSDVKIRGAVSLELVQFFWHSIIAQAHGEARADLWLRGPPDRPDIVGSLELFEAVLVPRDFEKALYLPQGRLLFSADKLVLENLVLEAGHERLALDGTLLLHDFLPTTLDVRAEGTVAADLLQLLLREQVSGATGRFALDLRAAGPWNAPELRGEIRPSAVEIVPRRWGRTLTLSGGAIRLEPGRIWLDELRGLVDEGGVLLDGAIDLEGARVSRLDLRLQGQNVPHRVPGQYDAELNLDLTLRGDDGALVLAGRVDLVDARYTRDFQVTRLVLHPKVLEEEEPAWRGIPALEHMALSLHVSSTGASAIRNNIADIALRVNLDVSGTPDDVSLDGEVRAEQGTFHIPLLKGKYTVDGGGVTFFSGQPIEQARVRIEGTTNVPDRAGGDHEVHLLVTGTLGETQLSLTSPGLEPGQVLALVATGRTTEQLRQELRGDEAGGAHGAASPGAAAADQSIKELTSDLFSVVVDPITKVFHADTAALEVGSESAHGQVCYHPLGPRLPICAEGDQYLTGGQHGEARAELKIDERLSAEAKAEHLAVEQNAFEPDLTRMRLQLRFHQRLRW
jgi:autotransporter translocation and assembly factor TamB